MVFTDSLDWQMVVAMSLMIATTLSKFLPAAPIKGRKLSIWQVAISVTSIYLLIVGYVSILGLLTVFSLLLTSMFIDSKQPSWVRYLSGAFAVLLFLALGFKALPGFNNQLLVDGQLLKGESTAFFKSYNFDKTFARVSLFSSDNSFSQITGKKDAFKSSRDRYLNAFNRLNRRSRWWFN